MSTSVIIFLGLCVLGAFVVAVCRVGLRRQFVRGREPMDLHGIFERDVRERGISYETFRRVYEALGRSFSLDPRLIRPSDSFKDILAFDSWALWVGKERMEKWLADNFEVREAGAPIGTVMDLLRLAQESPEKLR